jgi:hypothetical protein
MDELGMLAEWWVSNAYTDRDVSITTLAPQFAELCDGIAHEHAAPSFVEEIDVRVAVSLEDCLKSATPLGRYTASTEIRAAIQVYRVTESFESLNELAVFMPLITGYRKPSTLIAGLREHESFRNVIDWSRDASTALLTEALAVMVATVQLDGTTAVVSNKGMYLIPGVEECLYLADPELVDLVRSRTDKIKDIVDIVKDNPGIAADHIIDMFEHEQKALRGGVL